MRIDSLPDPELEFGGGGTHIDARFGLMQYGPLDAGRGTAPAKIRVGIVGTSETIEKLRDWLERGKTVIEGKQSRLHNLYPAFPGFSERSCFKSTLEHSDKWCVAIPNRVIDGLVASSSSSGLIDESAAVFLEGARDIASKANPSVLIIVPPRNLLDALDYGHRGAYRPDAIEIDERIRVNNEGAGNRIPRFEDVLKAKGMQLGVPILPVLPHIYVGQRTRGSMRKVQADASLLDEATRAWSFYVPLYYKAGGVPWKLHQDPLSGSTCYVGIGSYRKFDGEDTLTGIALIFNEMGEGRIIRGGKAEHGGDDNAPHLSSDDSRALFISIIEAYRREHKSIPGRVVVHMTSEMSGGELEGFESAAKEERIGHLDLLSVSRSMTRLFRESTYPPLRGTFLQLEEKRGLIYLQGSVNFLQTYPGLYVPRPLEFFSHKSETAPLKLAEEILGLSKLAWNDGEFVVGEPVTIHAARRAADILMYVPENDVPQTSFRFCM